MIKMKSFGNWRKFAHLIYIKTSHTLTVNKLVIEMLKDEKKLKLEFLLLKTVSIHPMLWNNHLILEINMTERKYNITSLKVFVIREIIKQ